jgi:integrase
MNSGSPESTESRWQKTPVANLVRHVQSGNYYARIRVRSKLIWKSLKTDRISVAKLRLSDFHKEERQRAASQTAVARGVMTFGDALEMFKQRLQNDPDAKPKTKEYYHWRISALLKSWPGLNEEDISKITAAQCRDWAFQNASKWSSISHNHTVSILRRVFSIAIEAGARYDNPGLAAKRVREKVEKEIVLPDFKNFGKMVKTVKNAGSGFSKPASELIEFLAYGGFRKGEARNVTWADCDFKRGEIIIKGDPETGTKNGEVRIIPMIPDMRRLLKRMKAERPEENKDAPVMRVFECQKSIDRASKILGIKRITHHDLRHLFATRCIESGVDIPTVSRWLGHKDGGALAMKTYGHLRNEHSQQMAKRVRFSGPAA